MAFGVDVVKCRPVLPAVAIGQRLLVGLLTVRGARKKWEGALQ